MKKANWGFDTRDMDQSVRPQDDFFQYVHGAWMKKTEIPANESRWGSFDMLHVRTQRQLRSLVERAAGMRATPGSPEQMIRDFFASGMNEKLRERLGTKPLLPYLSRIRSIASQRQLQDCIAELDRLGFSTLWGGMIDQDSKNSKRYALHLYQDGLGMPDRDYYLKDDAESRRIREAYVRHIEAMHRLLGKTAQEARAIRETVMRIETKLAEASMTKEDARDSEKTYHKLSIAKLQKLAPVMDWRRYLKAVDAASAGDLIVMQPEFMKAADRMLEEVPLEDWKAYLTWHLVKDSAGALSKKFLREQFKYAQALTGSKKMKPLWRRSLAATNASLGELIGQLYVREHFTVAAKERMDALVDDLFAAYEERIRSLDWMGPATKKKAVAKLKLMSRKIGYPDKWKSYKGLSVRPDDYFGNLMRSSAYEHKRQMRKLGRPIDRNEWFMYPQMVNAYYSPNMNDIVFPAAILQPPFFNLFADDALNYGAIGTVIGHEITHGFDDQGAKFDGKGNMKGWWTPEDKKRFEAKGRILKEQYDRYVVIDDIHINGQLTLGENIADLGGISIAYRAYQRHLERTGKREVIEGFTPEQRFFIGVATFDRELRRPEFTKMAVINDPHSPAEFRINGPFSNLQEFYDAFGVKKGDKLYREPKLRAKIW